MRAMSGSAGFCWRIDDVIDAAFGSHNLRSLAHAIVDGETSSALPPNGYEIQMLYGMAEPVRQAIIAQWPARAGLSAGGRIVAGDFLSDSPADGEHFEYFVPAPDLCGSKGYQPFD